MDEIEFLAAAETLFRVVEDAIDRVDCGIESCREGNVLTLECENGSQIVINIHAATREVWLASHARGSRFTYVGQGAWCSTRHDGVEFLSELAHALNREGGVTVTWS